MKRTLYFVLWGLMALVVLGISPAAASDEDAHKWEPSEVETIRKLWLGSLGSIPGDTSNAYAGDPGAAKLGRKFFFEPLFSGNKLVSCATCHRPEMGFTDNLPLAHGMGTTSRRSMPLEGMAYQTWYFWDGRKDSLWSQALGPIESPVEHGFSRTMVYNVIRDEYREQYESVFGPMPEADGRWRAMARPALDDPAAMKAWISMSAEDRAVVSRLYANVGKAIAAYVRLLMPGQSRFDSYAHAVLEGDAGGMRKAFSREEAMGLKLFIGKAGCINCHNGPLLTNGDFHNIGVPDREGTEDRGRAGGIALVLADEFNCLSEYSDAEPSQCAELRFIDTDSEQYAGAFKTPSLRGVADRPPYMHAGQFKTLREVLEAYREVSKKRKASGEGHGATDIEHAELTDEDISALVAFLGTLSGGVVDPLSGVK